MKNPKISVIIPAHNEEEDIIRTIDSVLNQTFKNFEIIVVNDGSTDKTRKIVERLMKKDKRIKLINFSKGHSAAFARNRGAEKAKGNIFVFLDADTRISKNFLKNISENIKKYQANAVGNFKENTYSNFLSHLLALLAYRSNEVYARKRGQIFRNFVGFNIFIITKKAFFDIGKYDEKIFYYEDEEMAKRFFSKKYFAVWDSEIKFYSEQPSSLKGFYRQYKWSGRGIATMKDLFKRRKEIRYSIIKNVYILFPLLLLIMNFNLGILALIVTYFFTYLYAFRASKSLYYSFFMVPVIYLKNFFELYNIIKFTAIKQ